MSGGEAFFGRTKAQSAGGKTFWQNEAEGTPLLTHFAPAINGDDADAKRLGDLRLALSLGRDIRRQPVWLRPAPRPFFFATADRRNSAGRK